MYWITASHKHLILKTKRSLTINHSAAEYLQSWQPFSILPKLEFQTLLLCALNSMYPMDRSGHPEDYLLLVHKRIVLG